MTLLDSLISLGTIATVIGLPLAVFVFFHVRRRDRRNKQAQIHRCLSDEYTDLVRFILDNPQLQLPGKVVPSQLLAREYTPQKPGIFNILLNLFECAFLLMHQEKMDRPTHHLWLVWQDRMREWCQRKDFRKALPELIAGMEEDFQAYIICIAESTTGKIT